MMGVLSWSESEKNRMTREPFTVSFADNDGKEVGKLIMHKGEISFEGNAKESARIFFEILIRDYMNPYLRRGE